MREKEEGIQDFSPKLLVIGIMQRKPARPTFPLEAVWSWVRAGPADPLPLSPTGLHQSLACDPAGSSLSHTQCFTFILSLPGWLPVPTHHHQPRVDPAGTPAFFSHLEI